MSLDTNGGGQITAITTAPVQASPVNDAAEFCDSPGAYLRFGLKRSLLYDLHARGLIKGVSLRKRGATKGKRLWVCDSIRSYLFSQIESMAVRARTRHDALSPRRSGSENALWS
jgi:hypothetical protein